MFFPVQLDKSPKTSDRREYVSASLTKAWYGPYVRPNSPIKQLQRDAESGNISHFTLWMHNTHTRSSTVLPESRPVPLWGAFSIELHVPVNHVDVYVEDSYNHLQVIFTQFPCPPSPARAFGQSLMRREVAKALEPKILEALRGRAQEGTSISNLQVRLSWRWNPQFKGRKRYASLVTLSYEVVGETGVNHWETQELVVGLTYGCYL